MLELVVLLRLLIGVEPILVQSKRVPSLSLFPDGSLSCFPDLIKSLAAIVTNTAICYSEHVNGQRSLLLG